MPEKASQKLRGQFAALGRYFGETGQFDQGIIKTLARPEKLPWYVRVLLRLLAPLGLIDMYWHLMLRESGAFKRRFARPY